MTADRCPIDATGEPLTDAQAQAAEAWLDGLAGRAGEGEAHAQGRLLRQAFDEQAPQVPQVGAASGGLDWADVQARAGLHLSAAESLQAVQAPAANAGQLLTVKPGRPRWAGWGLLASLMLGGVLVWPMLQPGLPTEAAGQWRGPAGSEAEAQAHALWLIASSESPEAAARVLSEQLRAWGARVDLRAISEAELELRIHCTAPCDPRISARLADMETALDGQGLLLLRVKARDAAT